ncbi:SDR family NAD(P)-dependent oxidoreductase [Candidatus Bealeia paramacronuclearis]
MTIKKRLEGKVALITGAGNGIGAAIAKRFAQEGAKLILVDLKLSDLEKVDDVVQAEGSSALLVPFDLKDLPRIEDLATATFDRFGGLDVLVGNAGILGGLYPTQDMPPSVFHDLFTVNFFANWHLIRCFDGMLKRSDAGRAIFTTSGFVHQEMPYWGNFLSSKSALEKMVLSYASEVKLTNLKVNLADPGQVRTKQHAQALPGVDPMTLPHPDEITEVFVRLSEFACPYHGQIVKVADREGDVIKFG